MTSIMTKTLLWELLLISSILSCKRAADQGVRTTDSTLIQGISYGAPTRYTDFDGDIWNTTWAADDNLYTYGNDAMAVGGTPFVHSQIVFGKLTGDDPRNLKGEVVNPFTDYNIDNWKSAGLISIDGVLYMTVMKHGGYLDDKGVMYQVKDASIIKSTDFGKTWSRSFTDNRDNPMFTDKRFCSPWFIQFGKDYAGADASAQADEYVYAISTDGYYDTGNSWFLGRVRKSAIGDLDASDWEFYCGDGSHASGLAATGWSKDITKATPIISSPRKVCKTGIQYIKGIRKYVMIQWYYKPPYDYGSDPHAASTSYWYFLQSDTPWGPWVKQDIGHTWTSEGLYCPVICPKFISDDGLQATIFATGNWIQANSWGLRGDIDDPYSLWTIPVTFQQDRKTENLTGVFPDGHSFSIKNAATAQYIAAISGGPSVELVDKADDNWKIESAAPMDRYYRIIDPKTGMSLQYSYGKITMGKYMGVDTQLWFIQYIGDGKYWIYPKSNSDRLLSAENTGTTTLGLVDFQRQHRDLQRWLLE